MPRRLVEWAPPIPPAGRERSGRGSSTSRRSSPRARSDRAQRPGGAGEGWDIITPEALAALSPYITEKINQALRRVRHRRPPRPARSLQPPPRAHHPRRWRKDRPQPDRRRQTSCLNAETTGRPDLAVPAKPSRPSETPAGDRVSSARRVVRPRCCVAWTETFSPSSRRGRADGVPGTRLCCGMGGADVMSLSYSSPARSASRCRRRRTGGAHSRRAASAPSAAPARTSVG